MSGRGEDGAPIATFSSLPYFSRFNPLFLFKSFSSLYSRFPPTYLTMSKFAILFALAAAAATSVKADTASLVASLKTATTEVAKVNLLNDTDVSSRLYKSCAPESSDNLTVCLRLLQCHDWYR